MSRSLAPSSRRRCATSSCRAAEQVQVEALRFRRPVRDGLEAQVEEAAARQVEPRLEPLFLAVDERPGAQGLFPEPAQAAGGGGVDDDVLELDRKSTRLNSSHVAIS